MEHLSRRRVVRAALVTDRDTFCLLRKKKLRGYACQSQLPIPYLEPVQHFHVIKKWNLARVFYKAPHRVIQRVYRALSLLSVYRREVTAGTASDGRVPRPMVCCG